MTTTTFEVHITKRDANIPNRFVSEGVTYFDSFEEAFRHLYRQICRRIDEFSITREEVESSFLADESGKPYFYFDAIEEAKRLGIFKDGKLAEKTSVNNRVEPVSISGD